MAQTSTKEKLSAAQPDQNLPAPRQQAAAPAFLAERMDADAGKGVSTDAADNQVPLVYVLQPLSPQVDRNDGKFIPGAAPGCVWLRGAPDPIVLGDEGFLFQPCYFGKNWVEWIPRKAGGGFVAMHAERPEAARQVKDPERPRAIVWKMPSGNEVKETRNHAGYARTAAGWLPYVIPLTSSGHTVSREWMFKMTSKKDARGKQVPSFATLYRIITKQRKNTDGAWYVLDPQDAGYVESVEDYERGRKLYEAFASGEKVAEAPAADDHASDADLPSEGKEVPF